jgi:hypothetical protein
MAGPRESVKLIQGAAMMRDAAAGMTYRSIAVKYGVSKDTVARRLSYAEQANLFSAHEDTILEGMVPLAEKALMKALAKEASDGFEGRPEVSLEVYKGTRLLKRDAGKAPSQLIPGGDESLDGYVQRLRERAARELETTDGIVLGTGLAGAECHLLGLPEAPAGALADPATAEGSDGGDPAGLHGDQGPGPEGSPGGSAPAGEIRHADPGIPADRPGEAE